MRSANISWSGKELARNGRSPARSTMRTVHPSRASHAAILRLLEARMRKRLLVVARCVFLLALTVPLPAQQSKPSADEAAVRAVDAKWRKAVGGYDLTRTLEAYADDAILMQPGAPADVGKPALRVAWHKLMNDNFFAKTWTIAAVEVSGDLAYTRGRYD